MKKTKHQAKITLSQETVRLLQQAQLPQAAGGNADTKPPVTGSGDGCKGT